MAKNVSWQKAPDIKKEVNGLIDKLQDPSFKKQNIHCFRSKNSKARAYARIWGFPKIWQMALDEKPSYIIEVISEKFDSLSLSKKREVLLHELAHIPSTFSGALVPHKKRGRFKFEDRVRRYIRNSNKK